MSEMQSKKIVTTDLWLVAALLCHSSLQYEMIVEDKARKRVSFQIDTTDEVAALEKNFYGKNLACEPTELKQNVTMIKARIEQLVK